MNRRRFLGGIGLTGLGAAALALGLKQPATKRCQSQFTEVRPALTTHMFVEAMTPSGNREIFDLVEGDDGVLRANIPAGYTVLRFFNTVLNTNQAMTLSWATP